MLKPVSHSILALAVALALIPNASSQLAPPRGGGFGGGGSSDNAQIALDTGMAKWVSHNITNYDFQYSADCPTWPCEDPLDSRPKNVEVRNGTIASVELADNWDDSQLLPEHVDAVKTPEDLFEEIQTAIDGNADTVEVQFDTNYGHPTYVLIDYSTEDETKFRYRIESLIDLRVTESRQAELDENRARWDSYRAVDYDYYYQRSCFCMYDYTKQFEVQVRNDTVDAAFVAEDGTPANPDMLVNWIPTIDGIFDQIQSAIDRSAYSMTIRYNETYGHPEGVSIDYNQMMADEELYISTEGLEILATEPVVEDTVSGGGGDSATNSTDSDLESQVFQQQESKSVESLAIPSTDDTSGSSSFGSVMTRAVALFTMAIGVACAL
jgi:hypothetical protein